jgi:SPP1 gp7 family putative phage head morphogenesis protein
MRDELAYRRDLLRLSREVQQATASTLFDLLKRLEPEYLRDSITLDDYGEQIEEALESLRAQFAGIDGLAATMAKTAVDRINGAHSKRFFAEFKKAVGVDAQNIVSNEKLRPMIDAKVRENVSLIKSIPSEQFAKIEKLVYQNTIQGRTSALSLQQEIKKLGDITDARAKFIARDQTAKINSAINTERNLSLGIEEYRWMTSKDGRVRDTHKRKQGQVFRFDTAPAGTGHPGEDYQCRCTARSIIPAL